MLWIYDLRTNKRYNPKNRHERKESERFKSFTYEDLLKRDKLNLDIFWLKDESSRRQRQPSRSRRDRSGNCRGFGSRPLSVRGNCI
jgi:hypothetical protein